MEKTRVVFRTWKKGEATVVALFPDTINGDEILVYEHDGQHSTTSKENVMKATPPRHGGRVGRLVLRAETSLQVRVFIHKEKMR